MACVTINLIFQNINASHDKTVRLWSTQSHQQIGQALEHTTWVSCVAISSSGELLASGDSCGNVHLWSIENALSAALGTNSSYLAHRSQVKLRQRLYAEALADAEKVRTISIVVSIVVMMFVGH